MHLAIEAFGLLVREGDKTHNLVIVGNVVDRRYYETLLELIDKYRISDRVHFIGHIPWSEMPAIYAAGVCTVIPTLDCEGTSLSALESMACGTPVLATQVAGLKDLPCLHAEPNALAFNAGLKTLLAGRSRFASEQKGKTQQTFNRKNWREAWLKVLTQGTIEARERAH